jgi:hypothetical protein
MVHAADFIASTNAAASEWARARTARTLVRAAMNSTDVVYRRTWPSKEALAWLAELEFDPRQAWNGWLDSTLDLRDGLSVVEVFAAGEEEAAATPHEEFADAWR